MLPPSPSNQQSGFNVLQTTILVFIVFVLALVVVLAYFSAQRTARDAKRVSDIQQLQLALKHYYEEFGYYPQASAGNQAVGVDNSFSRFVSPWPTPPAPDGGCTNQYNTYAYEQLNGGENYQLRFCLGGEYGNLKAGVRIVTPTGHQ
jgi:type II secretory pathway pseudopilin PulG